MSELAEIEAKVGSPEYWADPAMQERYRALLADEEAPPPPAEDDDGLPGILSPSAAAAQGIEDYRAYEQTMRAVGDVLAGLDDGTRLAVRSSFEALPEAAQVAALQALRPRGNAARATGAEVDQFAAATAQGAAQVREWGAAAGWRLGQCRERLERIYVALSAEDGAAFDRWWHDLDDSAALAVVRRLAGR